MMRAGPQVAGDLPGEPSHNIGLASFAVIGLLYAAAAWILAGADGVTFERLHIALDTGNAMLSGLFALFLWITAAFRKDRGLRPLLGVAFAFAAAAELLHALIGIEWQGGWAWINAASQVLRPATWPPSTYLLPVAMAFALWAEARKVGLLPYAAGILVAAAALYGTFLNLPSYLDTGFLGVHRPYQVPVLALLAGLAWRCWRERAREPILAGLARCLAFLFVSDFFMLFSASPHEKWTMVAHSGKFFGYLLAHFAMIESSLADIAARRRAEAELEQQASSLIAVNRSLQEEIAERKQSEAALRSLRDSLEATVDSRTRQFVLANEALSQQLAFSEHLVDAMPGIFYLVDGTGCLRRWNSRFEAVSGYGRDELAGKHALDFFRGADQGLIAERIAAVFRDGESDAQADFVTKDGQAIPYYFSGLRTVVDQNPCLIGLGVDITARKRQEARDRIRHRLFETLAGDGSLAETLRLATEYVDLGSSGLWCAILLADGDGRTLRVTMPASLPDAYARAVDSLEAGEGVACGATGIGRGKRVVAAGSLSAACWSEPIRDSGGAVVGTYAIFRLLPGVLSNAEIELAGEAATLAGIAIERKRIDDELQLAAAVYQGTSEAIIVCDRNNRIVAVNPAFTQLTGYGAKEVLGRDPKLLGSPRTGRELRDAMRHALLTTDHWEGEIWNCRRDGEEYIEWLSINTIRDAQGEVQRYIGMFLDITEQKRAQDAVWRQANYDPLTELPNRHHFDERLRKELKRMQLSGHTLALLFIDLDRFKEVNDRLGHDQGDRLLVAAARRIAACVRKSDSVARLGGDEFTAILPDLPDGLAAERVAQAIVNALRAPFALGAENALVSASVGVALYPGDAGDPETLMRMADQAMYAAKGEGRDGYCFFGGSTAAGATGGMAIRGAHASQAGSARS